MNTDMPKVGGSRPPNLIKTRNALKSGNIMKAANHLGKKNENISNILNKVIEAKCKRGRCEKLQKRRYKCPGKRRYRKKSSRTCCSKRYNKGRINLCTRNWARISINPFINFLRVFRRKFRPDTPIAVVAGRARCKWRKMTACSKKPYYIQAKRARCRGFRT